MEILSSDRGVTIRNDFSKKYTMSCDTFFEKYRDTPFITEYLKSPENYHLTHLIDRIDLDDMLFHRVSFSDALKTLRNMKNQVLFMSESEDHSDSCRLRVNGRTEKGFVAKAGANELADLVEYEWYESWRLSAMDMYLKDAVLPEDLYVFDESMEHVIVFTHENDFWELELTEPMKCAESRYCFVHGFS
ncbi:MAG: hypothetical protein IK149_04220 [Oscillospiraceae bacterium]|nr:hypothetical protein [Oscillospiraceae bacterium]